MQALLLDRDGTIIEDADYPRDPDAVRFVPGAPEALRALAETYRLYVVSNQSGVGRGIIPLPAFHAVHDRFAAMLVDEKIPVAGFFYCLHAPETECVCRKPRTGLVPRELHGVVHAVVGDKESDLKLADALGARGVLVRTGYGKSTEARLDRDAGYPVFSSLAEFARSR